VANKIKDEQPLFHRAIIQSSAANYPASSLKEAEAEGKEIGVIDSGSSVNSKIKSSHIKQPNYSNVMLHNATETNTSRS